MSVKVTVFTPTYNRAYIIHNLYRSLQRQTDKNFEWIVIDDGSSDDTEMLFQKWTTEKNEFSIIYYKIENGGKHRAINKAVYMASAEAFFIVDSDDYLVDNAVEKIIKWFEPIYHICEYAGVSGLKGYEREKPVGGWGTFIGEYVDATNLERIQYGLLKDKAEVYKTSVLKKYPFPEFEGENFLTEGIVWNQIAMDGYKIRWFKEVIYICDYLEDGLTKCGYKRYILNPKGYMAYLNLMSEINGKIYGDTYKFGFYFVMRSCNNIQLCRDKMQITLQEAKIFEEKYNQMLIDMNIYFIEHNVVDIAIYGLGNVGNAFLSILENLKINVKYAVDKQKIKKKGLEVYLPNEKLPPVDMIIITLQNYNEDVKKLLQSLFAHVVYWKDISFKYWIK